MTHIVQFFDLPETLATSVARFVHEALVSGQNALVVARPSNVSAIGRELAARGLSPQEAIDAGRLVIRDAGVLLSEFMSPTGPRPDAFEATVGGSVRDLEGQSPAGLSVYGEMVDILASEGSFDAAEQLEALWNDLGGRVPFTLMCGYSAAHFAANSTAQSRLHRICALHSDVRQDRTDMLATWLLSGATTAR